MVVHVVMFLKQYATHPKHLEVLEFIHSVTEQSVVVDYIK